MVGTLCRTLHGWIRNNPNVGHAGLSRYGRRSAAPVTADAQTLNPHISSGRGGRLCRRSGSYLTNSLGEDAPRIVVVEPERAACLYESAVEGRAIRVAPQASTVMAMLECYEPSLIAWRILVKQVSAFMTISEEAGLRAMAIMAQR